MIDLHVVIWITQVVSFIRFPNESYDESSTRFRPKLWRPLPLQDPAPTRSLQVFHPGSYAVGKFLC